jgi:hypothetical protein
LSIHPGRMFCRFFRTTLSQHTTLYHNRGTTQHPKSTSPLQISSTFQLPQTLIDDIISNFQKKKKRSTSLTLSKGLRGLASVTVVFSHLSRAFVGEVFAAATDDQPPLWYQLPFIRLLFQGRLGVSVFALVTGYVCALKPLKLYRQDNQEAAFIAISKSALRRFPRLFFPAAAATVVVWLLVETGLYTIAKHTDSFYLDVMSQPRIGNLGAALTKLVQEIVATWTKRKNDYDSAQWTMLPLLQESVAVYVFLVSTAYIRSRYRMLCALGMVAFYWLSSDCKWGL